jgi:hypothetical protein
MPIFGRKKKNLAARFEAGAAASDKVDRVMTASEEEAARSDADVKAALEEGVHVYDDPVVDERRTSAEIEVEALKNKMAIEDSELSLKRLRARMNNPSKPHTDE